MIENWEEFYVEIEKLSLPELEIRIKELYKEFERSDSRKDDKLDACLTQRKHLINKDFKYTPEVISHIERVNRILTESTAKVLQRTGLLYRQMLKLKAEGDDFLDDFEIEGTVSVHFNNEESILSLDEDENNGQSDYVAMAEILDDTQPDLKFRMPFSFSYNEDADWQASDEELGIKDRMLELNWNIELLSAPELSHIEYFCYGSHILFVDSNYSISDAIRVNDVWNEVKVTYQNWGEKLSNDYKNMIENWEEFYAEIEKLSLPELEAMIKTLHKEFMRSNDYKDERLSACLSQRRYLIDKNFKFSPEAVKHIERVNRILTESTAKVLQRTVHLYKQMVQLKAQGDDFLDDFEVEGTVSVMFNNEESILTLEEDENNGQSDYQAMSEVLEDTQHAFEHLRTFTFFDGDNVNCSSTDEELKTDNTLEVNWNIELLDAPELSTIEYFCYASHILFVESNYSISDAIRINDVWNEVKVTHQNRMKNERICGI